MSQPTSQRPVVVLVLLAITLPTPSGNPVPEQILVQCGKASCNIKDQYCYDQQCFSCSINICNMPDFDGGQFNQCYFYCENLDRASLQGTTPANNTAEDNTPVETTGTCVRLEIYQIVLIIFGCFILFGVIMVLFNRYQARKQTTTKKDTTAPKVGIVPPQGEHSGDTNPGESAELLVSELRTTNR